jgi:hypothetical protein
MFRDIERPKLTMLENEARLDADSGYSPIGSTGAFLSRATASRVSSPRNRFGDLS